MIARRYVLSAVCACIALSVVRAHAADAKSFVEAIYAAYKGKDAKGIPLDNDAAVRRYFEPKLAALIIKDRRDARGEVSSSAVIRLSTRRIGRSTASMWSSVTPAPTRRWQLFHSKAWASGGPLFLLWSSAREDGALRISRGIATELCAAF